MKRLVYSPKAFIFIRSRLDNKVYDVSDFVVSGSVTRNINAPSTAEFMLKNRFFEFSANKKARPKFLPNDAVTIWLQRIPGRPIQVFTGYLDSVPYYQMYPANGPFRATCTLKRLKNTFFDPGLQTTLEFFSKYGWTETADGTVINGAQQAQSIASAGGQSNDSGFGTLLYHFMQEICGWDVTSIWISDIPATLPKTVSNIFQAKQAANQIQAQAVENFFATMMTLKVDHGGTAGNTGPPFMSAVRQIYDSVRQGGSNMNPLFAILTALTYSGMYPYYKDETSNDQGFGYGIFGLSPNSSGPNSRTAREGASGSTLNFEGYTVDQIYSVPTSVRVLLRRMGQVSFTSQERKAISTPESAPVDILASAIAKINNKDQFRATIQESLYNNLPIAKQYLATQIGGTASTTAGTAPTLFWQVDTSTLGNNITWSDVNSFLSGNNQDQSQLTILKNSYYQKIQQNYNRAAAYSWVGLQNFGMRFQDVAAPGASELPSAGWIIMTPESNADPQVMIHNAASFYYWAASQRTTRGHLEVWANLPNATGGFTTFKSINGQQESVDQKGTAIPAQPVGNGNWPAGYVSINMTDNTNPVDPPVFDGQTIFSNTSQATSQTPTGPTNFTWEDLVKVDFASAFAAKFQFPTNFVESQLLSGDKSLMNDIPVLQGVEQLCGASMRQFMSMPTGDFIAFFPDYFGGFGRKPYWSIHETEIINMGINLSDDPLVTHMYVTGGTSIPGEVNLLSELLTQGVITLDSIFGSTKNFISGDLSFFTGDSSGGSISDFLRIYGARPKSIQNPIIRSHYYEFLYAFQMFMYMWSMQFATQNQFTFQPEVMAGGRIQFPDVGIANYIESVTHTFDYSSGFTTSAVLTAPTVLSAAKNKFPGMALATGISGFGSISTGM